MSDEYNVVHEKGCWGCEQYPSGEIEHCSCCKDQWTEPETKRARQA